MGMVWATTHLVTKRPMALKFLKSGALTSQDMLRRFLREARAASAVRHPNVVEIHDVIELEDGLPVMVMDLLIGESLGARLARERKLDLKSAAEVLVPVLSAVGTAHSLGIVHRDLKPDNIFLERLGDGSIAPKVLDFGIAKLNAVEGAAAQTAELTNTGSVMGTPFYMAPEQIFGEKDVDQRADVWAVGVILYEMLAGKRPMTGESFGQLLKAITMGNIVPLERVAPELPVDVTTLVGRMLSLERTGRPNDLREPFDILSRYSDGRAISFTGPRIADPSSSSPAKAAANAFAATEVSDPAPAPTDGTGFASTKGTTFFRRYQRRTLVIGAATFVGVLGTGLFIRSAFDDVQGPAGTGPDAGPSSTAPLLTAAPTVVPLTSGHPVPSASVSAAPSARPSSAPAATGSRARPPRHVTPPTTATTTTATATATAQRLPGGIASTAP